MHIKYTQLAKSQLKDIVKFYRKSRRTKSGKKIVRHIREKVQTLKHQPELGKIDYPLSTFSREYRFLIIRHNKIYYTIKSDGIYIVYVFDTRQNPSNLKL